MRVYAVERLVAAGLLLVFLGVLLIVAGILGTALRNARSGEASVEAGGIVFIGPIPIVFGTSRAVTKLMLALALVVTIALLILHLLATRQPRPPG